MIIFKAVNKLVQWQLWELFFHTYDAASDVKMGMIAMNAFVEIRKNPNSN